VPRNVRLTDIAVRTLKLSVPADHWDRLLDFVKDLNIGIAVLGLVIGVFLWWWRRWRKSR